MKKYQKASLGAIRDVYVGGQENEGDLEPSPNPMEHMNLVFRSSAEGVVFSEENGSTSAAGCGAGLPLGSGGGRRGRGCRS